jgi:hypothetical protein
MVMVMRVAGSDQRWLQVFDVDVGGFYFLTFIFRTTTNTVFSPYHQPVPHRHLPPSASCP